jgi:hypothetical protein
VNNPGDLPARAGNADEIVRIKLPADGSGKFYREIGFRLNRNAISCHMFMACTQGQFIDVPILAVPAGLTGGRSYYYGVYTPAEARQLYLDLFSSLTDSYLWNCSLRLRCSKGLKACRTFGNFVSSTDDLIQFPVLSRDQALTFEFNVTEAITSPFVFMQVGMLYTSDNRQRHLRVFTFQFRVSSDPMSIVASVDEPAMAVFLTKRATAHVLTSGRNPAEQALKKTEMLLFNSGYKATSLHYLLHALELSPLLVQTHPDGVKGRMSLAVWLRSCGVTSLMLFLYPRLVGLDGARTVLPLDNDSFATGSVFLFQTYSKIYIWVPKSVDVEYLRRAFGVSELGREPLEIKDLETEENQFLREKINECQVLSGRFIDTEVIVQGDPNERIFAGLIVDTPANGVSLAQWRASI